jgi:hypothetical protein
MSFESAKLKPFAYDKKIKIAEITKSPKYRLLFDATSGQAMKEAYDY